jgi:hypothetical protein
MTNIPGDIKGEEAEEEIQGLQRRGAHAEADNTDEHLRLHLVVHHVIIVTLGCSDRM